MEILHSTERGMCGVRLQDGKRAMDVILMSGLTEAIDQLAMANGVCWYGHVLRGVLDLEVEGEWKKRRLKRTWKKQVEEESVKVG